MAPSLLVLSCLFVLTATGEPNQNCANKENCNAEDGHLAAIHCRDNECECVPGSDQYDCQTIDVSATNTQNAAACKQFCTETVVSEAGGTTVQCVFYKFEQVESPRPPPLSLPLETGEIFSVRSSGWQPVLPDGS